MVNRKVIEVLFSSNLPQQAKQTYKTLKNTNPEKAQKYINSVFTETSKIIKKSAQESIDVLREQYGRGFISREIFEEAVKDIKRDLKRSGLAVGATATISSLGAKAAETTDKAAELFVPFYSATKGQINTVRDYLDGKISKDEYYKRIGSGTLEQAVDGLLLAIGGKAAGALTKKAASTAIGKAVTTYAKYGLKSANKVAKSVLTSARNNMVKANPKVAAQIKKGVDSLKGSIDEALSKITGSKDYKMATQGEIDDLLNGYQMATPAEEAAILGKPVSQLTSKKELTLLGLVKENAAGLNKLAKEVGVTKASDIPKLMKFTKQLGSIIENSPAYIRNMASGMKNGSKAGIIANTGLSLYDLYQAFKEGGDNLIPRAVGDVTRGATSLLPGGLVAKLLYGALGYSAGDKLTRAGLKKLGVKETTSDIENKEIVQGIRQPGLSEELPEYIEGQSGRKYHIVNDKIYDFATGKPVNIQQALQDADAYIQTQTQLTQDQLNVVNQQIADLEGAAQQGYNIAPDQLEPLYQQRETLSTQANRLGQLNFSQPEYDSSNNLIEQVYNREVKPIEQQQQAQQVQQQQDYMQTYEQVFNKIAGDTYRDLDNYYTPDTMALDYLQYMRGVGSGRNVYLSPDEFAQANKMQAMRQLAPKIHENAQKTLSSLFDQYNKQRDYQLELRKQGEIERHQQTKDIVSTYNAQEAARHNLQSENIDVYKAQSGRISAGASAMNAETNRAELPIKQRQLEINQRDLERRQQLVPYQQAEMAGSALSGASMSGMDLDTFINSNQSVMPQVFPEAFKPQSNQPQPQQSKPNIFQQGLNFLTGQGQ